MAHAGRIAVLKYMRECADEHRDSETGEINMTTLAEDACQHFNAYEGDDVPESFFEYAYEIERGDPMSNAGSTLGVFAALSGMDDNLR